MSNKEMMVSIAAILLSGVIAAFITIWYNAYSTEQMRKFGLASTLFKHRSDIGHQGSEATINPVPAIFHDHPEVIEDWKTVVDSMRMRQPDGSGIQETDWIDLLRSVMDAANIQNESIKNEDFLAALPTN